MQWRSIKCGLVAALLCSCARQAKVETLFNDELGLELTYPTGWRFVQDDDSYRGFKRACERDTDCQDADACWRVRNWVATDAGTGGLCGPYKRGDVDPFRRLFTLSADDGGEQATSIEVYSSMAPRAKFVTMNWASQDGSFARGEMSPGSEDTTFAGRPATRLDGRDGSVAYVVELDVQGLGATAILRAWGKNAIERLPTMARFVAVSRRWR